MTDDPTRDDAAAPAVDGVEDPHTGYVPVGSGAGAPEGSDADAAGRLPAWIPVALIGALVVGAALGVTGTKLFWDGGDGPSSPQAQASAGPGGGGGAASTITVPQVGTDDPDAFGAVEVAGGPLPRFGGQVDTAVGLTAPDLRGFDFEGNPVEITNDGRAKIILFVAHWCPYCREEVPIVRDWIATVDLPPDVDVYSVSTLTDIAKTNYPPRTWFEQERWNVPLVVDDYLDTAAGAFGLNAVPFWVLVAPDGTIAGRGAGGGVPAEALTSIADQLSATASPEPGS